MAASAAALGRQGYAVEVCACATIAELGVDENGTLWSDPGSYERHSSTRAAHTLVYVDAASPAVDGGHATSRWLWERKASDLDSSTGRHAAAGTAAALTRVSCW